MSEFRTSHSNTTPFEVVGDISTYQLPKSNELTPEQQYFIRTAKLPWVTNSAKDYLKTFEDDADFATNGHNFRAYFYESGVGPTYRTSACYKRFALLFPEIVEHLRSVTQKLDAELSFNSSDPGWTDLHKGYQLMCHFVDVNDPHVVRDGEATPDALFLAR